MTAVSPSEFYKANLHNEKEYVRIHTACELKAGDEIEMMWRRKATEDGYEFDHQFMTADEFKTRTIPADDLELPLPKKDLTEEQLRKIASLYRGEKFTMNDGKNTPYGCVTPYAAFLLPKGDGFEYIGGFELACRFNYAGQNPGRDQTAVFIWRGQQPVKGIILDTETTFAFKREEKTAGAGSILILDPESEDGYKLHCPYPSGSNSINKEFRLTAAWTQHKATSAQQAKLNARAPRIRIK